MNKIKARKQQQRNRKGDFYQKIETKYSYKLKPYDYSPRMELKGTAKVSELGIQKFCDKIFQDMVHIQAIGAFGMSQADMEKFQIKHNEELDTQKVKAVNETK